VTAELRFDQIQGNVTPGFRKDHQAFMLLQFPARESAQAWLTNVAPRVTSASVVREFIERLRAGDKSDVLAWQTRWINLAFSRRGLEKLGAPGIELFPEDFRQGLRERAARIADDTTLPRWEFGGTADREADALVVVAADAAKDLNDEVEQLRVLVQSHRLIELRTYVGAELGGNLRGHEHFGYRDGISQPDKELAPDAPAWGEFVLGYRNELGQLAPGPDWARYGSYAVFRRLHQNVALFRGAVAESALRTRRDITPDLLGAKLVGRWSTGAKLGADTERKPPEWPGDEAARITSKDFENDPRGERFPLVSHVRKANPRVADSRRHRLIRRGIPYGPPLAPREPDDGAARGLLFLAYQASLFNQFEHVQREWFNRADFPTAQTGRDPLIGQPGGPHETMLPMKGGPISIALSQFVTMTGGGYFFSPSIQALKDLADPGRAREMEAKPMADDQYKLGDFIMKEDPYAWQGAVLRLPNNLDPPTVVRTGAGASRNAGSPFQYVYEHDDPRYWEKGLFWNLGDTTVRISKAVRIYLDYNDEAGNPVRRAVVIGFEGTGGGP
jgi:Dyp-type peroxidase family